jgi:cytochrome c biogenesis protein CcmG, thiol:disulfide interchange protein DsbE
MSNAERIGRTFATLVLALAATSLAADPPPNPLLHKPAPLFVRTDLDAHRLSLRAYRGKVVLLNFWATWCAPCLEELPRFAAWQTRYGPGGLQVIAVSMDDTEEPVRELVDRLHLKIPVVMGDARLGTRFGGVLGLPITFLIDRRGVVVARLEGASDLEELEQRIHSLLDLK